MSAIVTIGEDNGAATGSPAQGATRTLPAGQVNWKNTDDVSTVYSDSPIPSGSNSYTKYQFARFTGTFNVIENCKWSHTAGTFGTGVTLKGVVTSTYATPATTTNAALTQNMTSTTPVASGQTVLFSTVGPQGGSPAATLTVSPGYTQYLATQLQTSSLAAPGDTDSITLSIIFDEA